MKQQAQDNITSVFQHLSWLPSEDILGPGLDEIEKFVMKALLTNIYAGNTINETRLSLFISSTSNNLRELPPCKNALGVIAIVQDNNSGLHRFLGTKTWG